MIRRFALRYKKYGTQQNTERYVRLYPEENKESKEITLQVTDGCNMACTYCYQHNKAHHQISLSDIKTFIDKLLNNEYPEVSTKNTGEIYISFIGGEPFLAIDLINDTWEYLLKRLIKLNHPWLFHTRFSICTNGLLYTTPKVQAFMQKYHRFGEVTFSIDGNKQLHDACRVDLGNNGTYDRAVTAMQNYVKLSGAMPSTKMTLSPDNIAFTKDAIVNLINLGYKHIYLNCIFEEGWNYFHARILYNQLKELSDYLIDNNLYKFIYISMFDDANSFKPLPEEQNDNFCGGVAGKALAIDWQGKFFPCLRYMESSLNGKQEPLDYGDIWGGYLCTKEQQEHYELLSNITRRSQSTDKCFYCPIAAGCGWCSGYCYERNGTPNKRTTFTCEMHQARALANFYYWNKIYQKEKIDKKFINYVPKDWALNIIDEKEWEEIFNG